MEGAEEGPKTGPIFRDRRRYYCHFCGICRSKKSLLASHVLSSHQDELQKREIDGDGDEEGQKSDNTCEDCGATFKKHAHLRQHLLSHSVERPFVCLVEDCESRFRRKDHLNRHLLQHKGKLFECPTEGCSSKFNVQGNIQRHLKLVHERKSEPVKHVSSEPVKHMCSEPGCGKEFKYASRLLKHQESHVRFASSEAFCSEPNCMKPFANAECLKAHMRSCHQYAICEVCGSKHLRKNIKRHLRTHEEHPTETTFKCTFEGCNHSFTTNSNLQQHIKAGHLNLRPFVCSVAGCGMRFALKHVRDNHEKTFRHVFAEGDLEELDQQLRSRACRGSRKRQYPEIDSLVQKKITAVKNARGCLDPAEYLSWLLSAGDDNDEETRGGGETEV